MKADLKQLTLSGINHQAALVSNPKQNFQDEKSKLHKI